MDTADSGTESVETLSSGEPVGSSLTEWLSWLIT